MSWKSARWGDGPQNAATKERLRTLLGVVLCALVPAGALAQVARPAGDPLDGWRAQLSARLNGDIARLNAVPSRNAPVVPSEGGSANDAAWAPQRSPQAFASLRDSAWTRGLAAILREQGLPTSLVSVVAVESGFNPLALSPKGARGLWQLMPATARRFGLVVSGIRDERTDPVRSTFAAAQYLKRLYAQFGSWPLALAAYNAGEGRVQRSLESSGASDFQTLSRESALPAETLRYVPAVLGRLGGTLGSPGSAAGWTESSSVSRRTLRGVGSGSSGQVVFAVTSPAE